MRPADQLAQFVRDALLKGRSREEIGTALARAGWTRGEVQGALDAWAETGFDPPVPRPRAYVSAREAFFFGLMFVALMMTAWHLSALGFALIDRFLPDPTDSAHTTFQLDQMRWSIASLIVFTPLFLLLNARTARAIAADPGKRRSGVRRWFGYITLFLAAMSLLGDLLWVIYAFLQGELGVRAICKAAVVALVAGAIFLYFRRDIESDGDAA
jgi:hypothetical protein